VNDVICKQAEKTLGVMWIIWLNWGMMKRVCG